MMKNRWALSIVCLVLMWPQHLKTMPKTDEFLLNTEQISRFGRYSKFDTLPLQPGQYILTIDDGPFSHTTAALIRTLEDRQIPATFFMTGRRADRFPELVKMVRDAGFGIGSHGYTHNTLTAMPLPQAIDDMRMGALAVERHAGGLAPGEGRLFRFPSSKHSPELLSAAHSFGMAVAGVDISPEDWRGSPPDETLERFRSRLRTQDRGVIVLHDAQPNTIALLPKVIDEIHARGGTFIKLVPQGSPPQL